MFAPLFTPLNKTLLMIVICVISVAHGVEVYITADRYGESIIRYRYIMLMASLSALFIAGVSIFKILKGDDPVIFWKQVAWRLPTFAMIYMVISIYCGLKSQIATINPYSLDPFFIKADMVLHFGKLPQEWLAGIYDNEKALLFIDDVYSSWFYMIYAYLATCLFVLKNERQRFTFLVPFTLIWFVIGNIIATFMASVGPVFISFYYPELTNPYAGYIEKMDAVGDLYPELTAYYYRDYLLTLQSDSFMVDANAPSAAPSLHVAMVVLMFLHSWRYARKLSYFFFAYCLITMAGSIILGWHYAAEIYLSAVMTYILWRVVVFAAGKYIDEPERTG